VYDCGSSFYVAALFFFVSPPASDNGGSARRFGYSQLLKSSFELKVWDKNSHDTCGSRIWSFSVLDISKISRNLSVSEVSRRLRDVIGREITRSAPSSQRNGTIYHSFTVVLYVQNEMSRDRRNFRGGVQKEARRARPTSGVSRLACYIICIYKRKSARLPFFPLAVTNVITQLAYLYIYIYILIYISFSRARTHSLLASHASFLTLSSLLTYYRRPSILPPDFRRHSKTYTIVTKYCFFFP